MINKDVAIVFDCGATNLRVVAIDTVGKIIASHALSNETKEDPFYPNGRIWDVDQLWDKLCQASVMVISQIDSSRIAGVTVTTFGVDGTLVDHKGNMLYPVISWQCDRTEAVMANLDKYIPLPLLYKISGVYPYAFNTINKLIWFKENKPELFDQSYRFLFISSLFIQKLTGEFINDATMLGTAMIADLKNRCLSDVILNSIGIEKNLFGSIGEPGDKAGAVTKMAEESNGIPANTPVFLAGHDTQFAIYGSGADLNQPVLSSGTWEILMVRSKSFKSSSIELENNLTTEADALSGVFNIGQNWLGSGVLEWFSNHFYAQLSGDQLYETMIQDAELIPPGSQGLIVNPSFYADGSSKERGAISGITLNTTRGQMYRAFLESLAYRLKEGLEALEKSGNFKATSIICVGGGSKNRLWNQLRADICKLPLQTIEQKETTVLGASLFVFKGAGLYKTLKEARKNIDYRTKTILPSANSEVYNQLYQNYLSCKNK